MVSNEPKNPTKKYLVVMVCIRSALCSVFFGFVLFSYLRGDVAVAAFLGLVNLFLVSVYIVYPLVRIWRGDYASPNDVN